jgi:ADP-heptose:LPS heptosyltransferase
MLYPARSILAIDLSPFGRSLGLLPAIKAVREAYPATFLVVAATTGTCELIAAANLADETIDLGVIKAVGNASGLKRSLTLARRSRRYNFDLILDFSPRLETMLVSSLLLRARTITPSSIPRAIEFFLKFGGRQLRSDDYASVLKQIGIKPEGNFQFAPSVEEDSRFEQFLARGGSRGGELIVLLYATGAQGTRGWTFEAFAEVGTRLANNFGARIIAADQPADREFTDAVGKLFSSLMLVAPRAPFLIAALARASIVVTDDGALARLAAGVGTPVIELGDSRADQRPLSERHRVVRANRSARVSTDEVYEIACEMIQESRSTSLFDRP